MPNDESNNLEIEETPAICERCENEEEDCDCILCDCCSLYIDHGCECSTCNHCGERFNADEDGCSRCDYCQSCIDRGRVEHYTCANCGRCHSGDRGHCFDCGNADCCASFACDEESHCTDCCDHEESRSYVQSYGCRDYPSSIPSVASRNFLYLGVENETEVISTSELDDVACLIHDKHSHEILMKEDGSLDNGIELVSGKYSLEAHQALWPRLCETAVKAGLRSWKHSTTGLHVHLSRRFFSQLALGKFVVFINSDNQEVRRNIRKLAGRDSNGYACIEKKKLTQIHGENGRYEAVNLTNSATIEVRIFKGTLKASHVLADIEFCHAVAYWVSQCSILECESWLSFWAYVLKNKKQYRNLVAFFDPASVATEETEKAA